jgi:hypothetical protein
MGKHKVTDKKPIKDRIKSGSHSMNPGRHFLFVLKVANLGQINNSTKICQTVSTARAARTCEPSRPSSVCACTRTRRRFATSRARSSRRRPSRAGTSRAHRLASSPIANGSATRASSHKQPCRSSRTSSPRHRTIPTSWSSSPQICPPQF